MSILPIRECKDISEGMKVSCNLFVKSNTYKYSRDGSGSITLTGERVFKGEKRIKSIHPLYPVIYIGDEHYTRDMLLVKGVDYE